MIQNLQKAYQSGKQEDMREYRKVSQYLRDNLSY